MLFQENILNGLQGKMNKNPLAQVCDLCLALKKQKLFALFGQDTVWAQKFRGRSLRLLFCIRGYRP